MVDAAVQEQKAKYPNGPEGSKRGRKPKLSQKDKEKGKKKRRGIGKDLSDVHEATIHDTTLPDESQLVGSNVESMSESSGTETDSSN